ncbi:hypothetical protein LTS10_005061 [Elasticomyces elasticus]|nr:hypothetical protein LTS10_005061 [Elasticomyces elasticus]
MAQIPQASMNDLFSVLSKIAGNLSTLNDGIAHLVTAQQESAQHLGRLVTLQEPEVTPALPPNAAREQGLPVNYQQLETAAAGTLLCFSPNTNGSGRYLHQTPDQSPDQQTLLPETSTSIPLLANPQAPPL